MNDTHISSNSSAVGFGWWYVLSIFEIVIDQYRMYIYLVIVRVYNGGMEHIVETKVRLHGD